MSVMISFLYKPKPWIIHSEKRKVSPVGDITDIIGDADVSEEEDGK